MSYIPITHRFIKSKALFQVIILIVAIISFSVSLSTPVAAQENDVCCEQTRDGAYCLETTRANCDPTSAAVPVTCEQTSYCQLGCCYDATQGSCGNNVGQAACTAGEGTFYATQCTEVLACEQGCCVLGSNSIYGTQQECQYIIDNYYTTLSLEDVWDPSVEDELTCLYASRQQEEGCCVAAGTCSWSARESCATANQINTLGGEGFYADKYCSNPNLQCACTPHHRQGCLPGQEDVYWFDSCGNKEGVAEDCDYLTGTLCSEDGEEAACKSLDCSTTASFVSPKGNNMNPHDLRMGGSRKYGESWCVYESAVGEFLDRPGSRHYRHLCVNGEELVEPCRDYREEVCLQGDVTITSEGVDYTYTEANCIPNEIYDSAITTNETLAPKGQRFWADENEQICETGSSQCTVVFIKKDKFSDWECEQNCKCMKDEWADQSAYFCKSKGDCGADVNIREHYADDGLTITSSGTSMGREPTFTQPLESWLQYGVFKGMKELSDSMNLKSDADTDDNTNRVLKTLGVAAAAVVISTFVMTTFIWTSISTVGALSSYLSVSFGFEGAGAAISVLTGGGATTFSAGASLSGQAIISGTATVAPGTTISIGGVPYTAGTSGASVTVSPTGAVSTSGLATTTPPTSGSVVGGSSTTAGSGGATGAPVGEVGAASVIGLIIGIILLIYGLVTADYATATLGAALAVGCIFGPLGCLIGALIGAILAFVIGQAEIRMKDIDVTCSPWVPPAGGNDCETCDDDPFKECSEYRCKSLGAACEWLADTEQGPACIDSDPNDVVSPIITPDQDALAQGYQIQPLPDAPSGGYAITPLVTPLERFTFGITLNEYGLCKYDMNHTTSYDSMTHAFGDSRYSFKKNITIIPNGDQQYDYYLRCQDTHGNTHIGEYVIKFTTNDEPDFSPPIIERTSIQNGAFLPYDTNETELTVYLNEPGYHCRWSQQDVLYDDMLERNTFVCGNDPSTGGSFNYRIDSPCLGLLTDLQPGTNSYYIRCEDLAGNQNRQGYPFSVTVTPPLYIPRVGPLDVQYTSDVTLVAETSGGADSGNAVCQYHLINSLFPRPVEFFNTGTAVHTQPLNLTLGSYNFTLSCQDIANNIATANVAFSVDVDLAPPRILQLYVASDSLYIVTDEPSTCEYSSEQNFSQGQGTLMGSGFSIEHVTPVQHDVYYVRCSDTYDNAMEVVTIYV